MESPVCGICGFPPSQIAEYLDAARDWEMTPDAYVRRHEGTYHSNTNAFFCTDCYVQIGMPLVLRPGVPVPRGVHPSRFRIPHRPLRPRPEEAAL